MLKNNEEWKFLEFIVENYDSIKVEWQNYRRHTNKSIEFIDFAEIMFNIDKEANGKEEKISNI